MSNEKPELVLDWGTLPDDERTEEAPVLELDWELGIDYDSLMFCAERR